MTPLTMADIDAPYRYVVSEQVISEVRRLILVAPVGDGTSVVLSGGAVRSILELEGLGKEIWKDVDATEYINDLRDEWNNR
jgi:hypothetical protein